MYNIKIGSRYDENLKTKDIAKLVKKEVKEIYKYIKIKTTTDYNMIRLDIIFNDNYKDNYKEVLQHIRNILNSYNYDGSEVEFDYSDNNFFDFINYEFI